MYISPLRMRLRRANLATHRVEIGLEEFNVYEGDVKVPAIGIFGEVPPSVPTLREAPNTLPYQPYVFITHRVPYHTHCTCADFQNPELDPGNGCDPKAAPYLEVNGELYKFCKHLIELWLLAESRFPELGLLHLEEAILWQKS